MTRRDGPEPSPLDGMQLPLGRRVRVELLSALQRAVATSAPGARVLRQRLPRRWTQWLRGRAAPVRIPDGEQAPARIPLGDRLPASSGHDAETRAAPAEPTTSIIVVTYGQLPHTQRCLESLRAFTDPRCYELLVVDNGSTDGTLPYLRRLRRQWPHLHVVENDRNLGFAGAVNVGARVARGRVLAIVNNDVVLTPGWLDRLLAHLDRAPQAGLVGPTTNDSGDAATIPAHYQSLAQMLELARQRAAHHAGQRHETDKLALFCTLVPRATFEEVGGLDEGYRRGMFEDDDFCRALHVRGKRVLLAEDVFVHHTAGASFRQLSPRQYMLCFEANRHRFETKWSVRWQPRVGAD